MKLESVLEEQHIEFEKHTHPPTYTAQRLADVEHVSGYLVAKPVVVRGRNGYAICVLPAPKQLDINRVAEILGDPDVRLATESEMTELFPDCELGAEPPVGSMFGMRTIMDSQLRDDEFIIMQAGTHTEAIKTKRADWERLCNPIIGRIARSAENEE
jgi:Ala-tRNA(Pro) deacylase